MSGAAMVALLVLCFAGGYILVNAVFDSFAKKNQANAEADRFRKLLSLPAGATMEQLDQIRLAQLEQYTALAANGPDEEMRRLASRRISEVEEAYAYFRRNPKAL